MTALRLDRQQILGHRRRVGSLDRRLPGVSGSLRLAAWAGLQDSMPRAALLSIHARVDGTEPDAWEDVSLVQVWGPRYSAYVVAAEDRAVFTLGRLPDQPAALERAEDVAGRLRELLGGESMSYADAGHALGMNPNRLRYAAPTGTVLLRWEGAGRPTVRVVDPPEMDPADARLELARRHLHVFGPSTVEGFVAWAGIRIQPAAATWEELREELIPVSTPVGESWILTDDLESYREEPGATAPARLLPSGDSYWLYWGEPRKLLVSDAARRDELWTSRVWPGAVLVEGEIVGVWRRRQNMVTVDAWRQLTRGDRYAVEKEARSLPLPGVDEEVVVDWAAP